METPKEKSTKKTSGIKNSILNDTENIAPNPQKTNNQYNPKCMFQKVNAGNSNSKKTRNVIDSLEKEGFESKLLKEKTENYPLFQNSKSFGVSALKNNFDNAGILTTTTYNTNSTSNNDLQTPYANSKSYISLHKHHKTDRSDISIGLNPPRNVLFYLLITKE